MTLRAKRMILGDTKARSDRQVRRSGAAIQRPAAASAAMAQ
jgi:hypothetical protein